MIIGYPQGNTYRVRGRNIIFTLIRYSKLILFLLLYTILIHHLIDYDNFPLSPSYQFPLNAIRASFIPSILCVAFVEWYYQHLLTNRHFSSKQGVVRFVKMVTLFAVGLFVVIYSLTEKKSNDSYYFVISLLLTMINLFLWLATVYGKQLFVGYTTKSDDSKSLKIKSGSKIHNVEPSEISHFCLKNKLVIAHLKSGTDVITDFSLSELEDMLPNSFFRINRQFILNKDIIKIAERAKNRTYKVQILNQNLSSPLIVSRYRASDFKKWFL